MSEEQKHENEILAIGATLLALIMIVAYSTERYDVIDVLVGSIALCAVFALNVSTRKRLHWVILALVCGFGFSAIIGGASNIVSPPTVPCIETCASKNGNTPETRHGLDRYEVLGFIASMVFYPLLHVTKKRIAP